MQNFTAFPQTKIENPIPTEKSKEFIKAIATNFNILSYDENTVMEAVNLEQKFGIHFWDALIAATMQENSIDTIYTENTKDFAKVPWLKAINPFKSTH